MDNIVVPLLKIAVVDFAFVPVKLDQICKFNKNEIIVEIFTVPNVLGYCIGILVDALEVVTPLVVKYVIAVARSIFYLAVGVKVDINSDRSWLTITIAVE